MLTTNKAVYGTDGSLTELGKLKGGGSKREPTIYFNKSITDNIAEKLGAEMSDILDDGSKSPLIIINLIDTNTGAYDVKTILFDTFSHLFKHDSAYQEYISFGLPDSDGIINNVKLYSGGKIDDEYTVVFNCENGDISASLLLQIYAL